MSLLSITLAVAGFCMFGGALACCESPTHKWRGGRGPETSCHYSIEDDPVPVGKTVIVQQNTYTVCS